MRVHSASLTCTLDSGSMAIRKWITRKISDRSSASMDASGSTWKARGSAAAAIALLAVGPGCATAPAHAPTIRVATYNTSLNDDKGELIARLRAGDANASR